MPDAPDLIARLRAGTVTPADLDAAATLIEAMAAPSEFRFPMTDKDVEASMRRAEEAVARGMAPAPDRVWLIPVGYESWRNAWVVERPDPDGTEYTRADLPPTLAQALAVPEVRALVEALRQFAAWADVLPDGPDGRRIAAHGAVLEYGHIRAARAALRAIEDASDA